MFDDGFTDAWFIGAGIVAVIALVMIGVGVGVWLL